MTPAGTPVYDLLKNLEVSVRDYKQGRVYIELDGHRYPATAYVHDTQDVTVELVSSDALKSVLAKRARTIGQVINTKMQEADPDVHRALVLAGAAEDLVTAFEEQPRIEEIVDARYRELRDLIYPEGMTE